MFRNYLLITFRNLYKNRIFALINILGLGLALAICIVAYFNHMFDHDFDRHNENFKEIYRVNCMRQMENREQEYGMVPVPIGPDLPAEVPGLEHSARLARSYSPVKVGIDNFNRQISYVDPVFLDIFTFPLLSGSREVINDPNMVLISKEMADILYGDEEAVGMPVSIFNDNNQEYTYTIGAVFEDLPMNSSFRIDILTHLDNFLQMWNVDENSWTSFVRALFIQVPSPQDLSRVEEALQSYIPAQNEANESFVVTDFRMVPMKEVSDNSRDTWNSGLMPGLHPAAKVAPLIMALTILLIASFNFANTAIATAGKRLMEIGTRKVLGGERRQLLLQFLIENYIICFLALLVGILISYFLVPAYSSMWDYMKLSLSFTKFWSFWIFLVLLLLVTGFLAGAYPALYISSFRPLKILQSRTRLGRGGPLARILLGFQFSISVLSIVSGIVFSMNARYQDTVDMGFERKELLMVPTGGKAYERFYQEIQANPRIISAAGAQEHIGWGTYRRSIKEKEQEMEVNFMDVGPEYLQTMGVRLLDGRLFSRDREEADRGRSIVVNQMLVDAFGWGEEAIGKVVYHQDTIAYEVVGVVKDFFTNGMWAKVNPTLVKLPARVEYYNMAIRTLEEDRAEVLDFLKKTWIELYPNYPFGGRFQEDLIEEERNINRSIKHLYIFLAIVAVLLSMSGLYTLVSLSILNRTKEIGIRKVMGAPEGNIFYVLSRSFLINLAISSVLGCVGGFFLSDMLLDSIWDQFLDFTSGIYLYSVIIIFAITLATMAGRILKAARMNPAEGLRYE